LVCCLGVRCPFGALLLLLPPPLTASEVVPSPESSPFLFDDDIC